MLLRNDPGRAHAEATPQWFHDRMGSLPTRSRSIPVGVAVLVLLAGGWLVVRQTTAADAGRGPPRPGATDSLSPFLPPTAVRWDSADPLTVTQTETDGFDSTPWRLYGAHGRTVRIAYVVGSGSCEVNRGVYVGETARRILVGTYVSHLGGADAACTADLRIEHVGLRLKSPLGQRTLVHAVVTWGSEMASQLTF